MTTFASSFARYRDLGLAGAKLRNEIEVIRRPPAQRLRRRLDPFGLHVRLKQFERIAKREGDCAELELIETMEAPLHVGIQPLHFCDFPIGDPTWPILPPAVGGINHTSRWDVHLLWRGGSASTGSRHRGDLWMIASQA